MDNAGQEFVFPSIGDIDLSDLSVNDDIDTSVLYDCVPYDLIVSD